ncbi:MAG TPA: hypothetical protein VFE53_26700 [Mucilaginibacter sp.]|nr:hypothetical protein [Mucilaginibacter sp.]
MLAFAKNFVYGFSSSQDLSLSCISATFRTWLTHSKGSSAICADAIIPFTHAALLIEKKVKLPKFLIHSSSDKISDMLKIYVTIVLLAGGAQLAFAQKRIILSDSLTANANVLPVTFIKSRGFNAFPKLRFGDYAVVSGKWGMPLSNTSSNVFGTKSGEKLSRKFSFILIGTANDSVQVKGVMKTVSETRSPLQVSKSFSVGGDEQIESLNFSATIAVTGDSSHLWTLSMKTESGGETAKYEGFLTDGKRNILITPVRTNRYEIPAYGYEFTENDRFYSAYQYTSTISYKNQYAIYLDKSLDPKMKLALSGAMVALLELKDSPDLYSLNYNH